MAAKRNGIRTVIIPKDNERDLDEIDQTVRAALQFFPVSTVDEVFAQALCYPEKVVRMDEPVAAFAPELREISNDAALRQ